jgi:hypothetical protein
MKRYHTLAQAFSFSVNRTLGDYFDQQGIKYDLGADQLGELRKYGYRAGGAILSDNTLIKRYVVLLDEHELSAIMLCVDHVQVIRNRTYANTLNKIRGWFKWFLK